MKEATYKIGTMKNRLVRNVQRVGIFEKLQGIEETYASHKGKILTKLDHQLFKTYRERREWSMEEYLQQKRDSEECTVSKL